MLIDHIIKDNLYHISNIVKQLCYFAKVCDQEFSKKQLGSTYFHSNFVYKNKRLTFVCENATQFVFRYCGLLLEDSEG